MFFADLLTKLFVLMIGSFTKPIIVFRGENAAYEFIKAILMEYKYCEKVMNKTLIKI